MINDKMTKEEEKQLEEQLEERVTNETKKVIDNISSIIAQYTGFKASSDLMHKKTAEALKNIEGRLRVIEHTLEIPEAEE